MIFVPIFTVAIGARSVSLSGAGHRVHVEGEEFVARCGARFGTRSDGALYQVAALYRSRRCEACEGAKA